MNPNPLIRYQLRVTFISESSEIFDTIERVTGCARRSGVTLINIEVAATGARCSGYLHIGSDRREATDLLAHRLRNLIGLDELVCRASAGTADDGLEEDLEESRADSGSLSRA